MRPRWRLAIGALVAGLVVGCGGGSAPPEGKVVSADYAVFTASVHLAGEIRVDGQFTDAITGRGETCAQYAEGQVPATTLWVTPTPSDADVVGGHTVSFTAGVAGSATTFAGPGVYAQPAAQVDVLLVDNSSFVAGDHPTTVITVTSSGSGSMAFTDMVDSSSPDQIETGGETWTCTSPPTIPTSRTSASGSTVVSVAAPILRGTLDIGGAYPSSERFSTRAEVDMAGLSQQPPASLTCADYAKGMPSASSQSRSFVAPEIDTAGNGAVYFDAELPTGYAGPGSYSSQAFPALTGRASITIPPASAPQIDTFTSQYGGSLVLSVQADGSGMVRLIGWGSGGSDSKISGTVTWTCSAGP